MHELVAVLLSVLLVSQRVSPGTPSSLCSPAVCSLPAVAVLASCELIAGLWGPVEPLQSIVGGCFGWEERIHSFRIDLR